MCFSGNAAFKVPKQQRSFVNTSEKQKFTDKQHKAPSVRWEGAQQKSKARQAQAASKDANQNVHICNKQTSGAERKR